MGPEEPGTGRQAGRQAGGPQRPGAPGSGLSSQQPGHSWGPWPSPGVCRSKHSGAAGSRRGFSPGSVPRPATHPPTQTHTPHTPACASWPWVSSCAPAGNVAAGRPTSAHLGNISASGPFLETSVPRNLPCGCITNCVLSADRGWQKPHDRVGCCGAPTEGDSGVPSLVPRPTIPDSCQKQIECPAATASTSCTRQTLPPLLIWGAVAPTCNGQNSPQHPTSL